MNTCSLRTDNQAFGFSSSEANLQARDLIFAYIMRKLLEDYFIINDYKNPKFTKEKLMVVKKEFAEAKEQLIDTNDDFIEEYYIEIESLINQILHALDQIENEWNSENNLTSVNIKGTFSASESTASFNIICRDEDQGYKIEKSREFKVAKSNFEYSSQNAHTLQQMEEDEEKKGMSILKQIAGYFCADLASAKSDIATEHKQKGIMATLGILGKVFCDISILNFIIVTTVLAIIKFILDMINNEINNVSDESFISRSIYIWLAVSLGITGGIICHNSLMYLDSIIARGYKVWLTVPGAGDVLNFRGPPIFISFGYYSWNFIKNLYYITKGEFPEITVKGSEND